MNKASIHAGRTAVVTGAGGTLCSVIEQRLALAGARVVLVGRTEEKLKQTAEKIDSDYEICVCDVTDEKQVVEAAKKIGKCDYLINGAGGNDSAATTQRETYESDEFDAEHKKIGFFDLNADALSRVIEANTMGTLIPCRVFGRLMAEGSGGSIVNFASMNSYKPLTKVPAYSMSKAAILNFTEWLAGYLAPDGIRVNAVAPGFFVNPRSQKLLYNSDGSLSMRGEKILLHTPMKRFGEAWELWGCIDWLLDETRSGFVTGICVPIDGGFSAHSGV